MSTETSYERRTLVALVRDEPGVLTRIATAFRRRGFNIASLSVSASERPEFSRMTFVVEGLPHPVKIANLHLARLIEVVEVLDVTHKQTISAEIAFIKVKPCADDEVEVIRTAATFDAKAVALSEGAITFQIAGSSDKVNAMVGMLNRYNVVEVSRSGPVVTLHTPTAEDGQYQLASTLYKSANGKENP